MGGADNRSGVGVGGAKTGVETVTQFVDSMESTGVRVDRCGERKWDMMKENHSESRV